MSLIACRDCGYMLDPNSRGCPKCARNVEAEKMIARFVWHRLVPALVILALAVAGVLLYEFH